MPSEWQLRAAEAEAALIIRVSMINGYNRVRRRNDRPTVRNVLDTDRKTPITETRLGTHEIRLLIDESGPCGLAAPSPLLKRLSETSRVGPLATVARGYQPQIRILLKEPTAGLSTRIHIEIRDATYTSSNPFLFSDRRVIKFRVYAFGAY